MLLLLYRSACIAPPGTEFMHSRVRSTNTGAGADGGGGQNNFGSTEIGKVATRGLLKIEILIVTDVWVPFK